MENSFTDSRPVDDQVNDKAEDSDTPFIETDDREESFSLAAYCLTNFGTVVEIIFSYLTARQLCKASTVCGFWNELANKEKLKRTELNCRLVYMSSFSEQDDDGDQYDEEDFMASIQDQLTIFIENIRSYPTIAILYLNRCEEFFGSVDGNESLRCLTRKVKRSLPPDCPLVGCLAGGVIGSNRNGKVFKNEEVEMKESSSLVLVPSFRSTHVRQFFLKLTDIRKTGKNMRRWGELLGFTKEDEIKLVLLHACCEPNEIDIVINMILEFAGPDVVIAGGLAEHVIFDGKLKSKGVVGVVFSGDLTTNIVVQKSTHYPDYQKAVTFLKDVTPPSKNSLMLMYSCVARGRSAYDKINVETTRIAEILPKVPTFGFFAFGEIGYEPLDRSTSTQLKGAVEDNFVHSYSTVLCLCSIAS